MGVRNDKFATQPQPIAPGRYRDIVVWLALFGVTVAAYWPSLRGGLLWDDEAHITRLDLQSLHGLWNIWFHLGATQQYYPLLHSTFWLEHQLWGDALLGYHLTSVVLHAVAACLVVQLVRRLGLPGAWLAGLVFALHPVCVESVAWISEQKSTLSGVFYLGAALVYLGFDDSRRKSRYWLALALFVLALASKTVTATLPATLLIVLWWRRGRIGWRRDVMPLLPWFATGAASGLFTAWVERTYIGAAGAEFSLSLLQRILLAGRAACFYATKLIWPVDLTFFYPRWTPDPAEWWQYLFPALVLGAIAGFAMLMRRKRGPLAALLVFLATLFPVLGFLNVYPFRYSFVADHFQYLACLALIVPICAASTTAARRIVTPALSRQVAAGALAAVLLVLTFQQSGTYRDAETLYRETVQRNPGSWLAYNNLGNILLARDGASAEAMADLQTAIQLKPDYSEAHLSLANGLMQMPGRVPEAISEYEVALRYDPKSERAENNLGEALLQAGRAPDAIAHLQSALRLQPAYAEAHNNLGNALTQSGRLPEAIAEYQAALRIDPQLAEAHNNLGRVLAQTGNLADSIAHFRQAIGIRPDYAGAHSNLGNALSMQPGGWQDAVEEYRAALRIRPDSAAAHNNLGFALAHLDRLDQAVAEYREAIRLNPDFIDAHYNLASALARMAGHRQEAAAEYETVARLRK